MTRTGWFADIDKDDAPSPEWLWQPCLQLDGMCLDIDIHFRSREECEQFIRDDILGKDMLPDTP